MTSIFNFIKENPDSSVKHIVYCTELSQDQVRYQIKTQGDKLRKSLSRPARFSVNPKYDIDQLMEDVEEGVDIKDLEEAIKKDKPKRKILTSQVQLDKMVREFHSHDIKMEYSRQERYWNFNKGWIEIKIKSKELPNIRINLLKWMEENFNEI